MAEGETEAGPHGAPSVELVRGPRTETLLPGRQIDGLAKSGPSPSEGRCQKLGYEFDVESSSEEKSGHRPLFSSQNATGVRNKPWLHPKRCCPAGL
jgi:hypothetical protein